MVMAPAPMNATNDLAGAESPAPAVPAGDLARETLTLRLAGELGVAAARDLHLKLAAAEADPRVRAVVVDLDGAGGLHSAAVASLTLAARRLRGRGKSLRLRGLAERHRSAFSLAAAGAPDREAARGPALPEVIGGGVLGAIEGGYRL